MKYSLSSLKGKGNTELMFEDVTAAKTGRVRGYGMGVTFTYVHSTWKLSSTFVSQKLIAFCEPEIVSQ